MCCQLLFKVKWLLSVSFKLIICMSFIYDFVSSKYSHAVDVTIRKVISSRPLCPNIHHHGSFICPHSMRGLLVLHPDPGCVCPEFSRQTVPCPCPLHVVPCSAAPDRLAAAAWQMTEPCCCCVFSAEMRISWRVK